MSQRIALPLLLSLGLLVTAACHAPWPAAGTPARCAAACTNATTCDSSACARGCSLVNDRVAEGQSNAVLHCVRTLSSRYKRCDDVVWATCAARVGPYADGGPPAPAPPPDLLEDDE